MGVENFKNEITETPKFDGLKGETDGLKIDDTPALDNVDNKLDIQSDDVDGLRKMIPHEHNEGYIDSNGNGVFKPPFDYVGADAGPKVNPEHQTLQEVLLDHGADGIEFKDGYPDFSKVAEAEVTIDDMTTNRDANFKQADAKYAEQHPPMTANDVAHLRDNELLTWHECEDTKTMQLVDARIHSQIPHAGGVSVLRQRELEE